MGTQTGNGALSLEWQECVKRILQDLGNLPPNAVFTHFRPVTAQRRGLPQTLIHTAGTLPFSR